MAKEYTKQDIVGYYFEVSLATEYTKEDILQWFECRNVSLWLKNIPNKILLATILKSLWLQNIPKKHTLQWFDGNVSLWLKNIPKKILLATTLKLDRVRNLTNNQYGGKMCQNCVRLREGAAP